MPKLVWSNHCRRRSQRRCRSRGACSRRNSSSSGSAVDSRRRSYDRPNCCRTAQTDSAAQSSRHVRTSTWRRLNSPSITGLDQLLCPILFADRLRFIFYFHASAAVGPHLSLTLVEADWADPVGIGSRLSGRLLIKMCLMRSSAIVWVCVCECANNDHM